MIVKEIELCMQQKRELKYLSPHGCFLKVLEWTIAMKMLPKNKLDLKKYIVKQFLRIVTKLF
jgi:hypothetical protein